MTKKNKFKKVLMANRGEIAVRIIRACKELGLSTVAIYSEADKASAHVALADECVCIGPATPSASYLNQQAILDACSACGADALHPGFGFFAENAPFARACAAAGVTFIGPDPDTIELMGDKLKARAVMEQAGVPVIKGSSALKDAKEAAKWAKKIGFPVLLKAAAGGGGKGMRVVTAEKELDQAFENTQREALNYFANDEVFIEKYIESPHHVEIQILGDSQGNIVHLFERECSIQRRHQKVIEEAPSPFLVGHDSVREKLFQVAIDGAQKVKYQSAGTMEFIVDKNRDFFFLEMNTRIQVEHPVTEWITGIDLMKEQISIAQGLPISVAQDKITLRGHSIECRLYAEHPDTFVPTPGKIDDIWLPGGPFVRVDMALLSGEKIPLDYDPMLGKISVWGWDRAEAMARMQRALGEVMVAGTVTNISFLRKVLAHKGFIGGNYSTKFIEEEKEQLATKIPVDELREVLSMLAQVDHSRSRFAPGPSAPWMDMKDG